MSRSVGVPATLGLAAFLFLAGWFHVTCPDAGFHVRTGEWIVTHGAIPSVNTFAHTVPDAPWYLHQWWPGILFYAADKAGGTAGLVAVKACLWAIVFLLVLRVAQRECRADSLWPFWAVTAGVLLARVRFFERPYVFSAVFLVLLLGLQRRYADRWRWHLAGFPLLMAAWANTHAGIIDGLLLYGAMAVGESCRRGWRHLRFAVAGGAVACAAAAVSTALINPHGMRVLAAPFEYFLNPFWDDAVTEYAAPHGWQAWGLYAWLGVLAILAVRRAWRDRSVDLALLLPAVLFGMLACRVQRLLVECVIVTVPWMASLGASASGSTVPERAAMPARPGAAAALRVGSLAAVWVLAVALVFVPDHRFRFGPGYHPSFYPMPVFNFLRTVVPPQPLYNDMQFGGGMLKFLYPAFRPFVDGRFEAYGIPFWRDAYLPVREGRDPAWREILDRYQAGGALVAYSAGSPERPLVHALRENPDFSLVAFDDRAMLFLKRTERNAPIIDRYGYRVLWPGDPSLSTVSTGTLVQATSEAWRAFAVAPEARFPRLTLARCHMLAGAWEPAAAFYGALIREGTGGGGARLWRDYGYCLAMAGQQGEASAVFDHMIRRNLDPAFAWYMRSFERGTQGDAAGVRQCLEAAVRLDPTEPIYREALQGLSP